jgi:signal transduction histidine kinase
MQRAALTRLIVFAFAAWTVVGVASFAARWGAARLQGQPAGLAWLFASVFLSVWLWAAFTPAIVWAAARWPVLGRSRRAAHYGIHALILLALTAVEAAAYGAAQQLLSPASPPGFAVRFLALFTLALVSYGVIAAAGNAHLFFSQLAAERAHSAQLAARLATAQLAALRAQLHPHFFFNTLNAIAEMIHRDPAAADRMVTRLGVFLRRSLDSGDVQEVPLGDEVDALGAYLDVVHLRFGNRIRVALTVEPEVLDVGVPPLILQPLVENALKHGLEPKEGGGFIDVSAERRGCALCLEVRDDGVGLAAPLRERVGMRNTRERLRQLYGDAASLDLRPRPGGGAIATVTVPIRRHAGDAPLMHAPQPHDHDLAHDHR